MSDQTGQDEGRDAEADKKTPRYSFEEYRIMYESTELVSERKITFTRSNSSLCIAIIAGLAVAGGWIYDKGDVVRAGAIGLAVVCLLASIFCVYWIFQLLAFKDLNAAKFKVLEEMAENLAFPDYTLSDVRSKNPFAREYEILKGAEKLYYVGGREVLKAHFTEMVVPISFLAFFLLFGGFCIFWAFSQ